MQSSYLLPSETRRIYVLESQKSKRTSKASSPEHHKETTVFQETEVTNRRPNKRFEVDHDSLEARSTLRRLLTT